MPLHEQDYLIRVAQRAYARGEIDRATGQPLEVQDLERAIDHIMAGGRGCAEFPYLPVFPRLRADMELLV